MLLFLHEFPWYLSALIFISGFIGLVLLGLFLVRHFVPSSFLRDYHDVSGIIFNIIGVLYAVLLGFTILNAQDRYTLMRKTIESEADTIANLFRDSQIFSEKDSQQIRDLLHKYIQRVINNEWKEMAKGNPDPYTSDIIRQLWFTYYNIELTTDKQKIWYEISISKLNDLSNFRLLRVFSSKESLVPMMWTLLLLGGLILVFFIYFFWMDLRLQIPMAILLAGNVAFMLFLIFSLDNPFIGGAKLQPFSLERVSISFNQWEAQKHQSSSSLFRRNSLSYVAN